MRMTVFLLTLLAGCDQFGPEAALPHAAASLWCGPADQGYTSIVLAKEPVIAGDASFPYVGIGITEYVTQLAGRTFNVTDGFDSARYIRGPNTSESALVGRVRITSVDSANTVVGSVSLRFPSRIVDQQFTAQWIPPRFLCG